MYIRAASHSTNVIDKRKIVRDLTTKLSTMTNLRGIAGYACHIHSPTGRRYSDQIKRNANEVCTTAVPKRTSEKKGKRKDYGHLGEGREAIPREDGKAQEAHKTRRWSNIYSDSNTSTNRTGKAEKLEIQGHVLGRWTHLDQMKTHEPR